MKGIGGKRNICKVCDDALYEEKTKSADKPRPKKEKVKIKAENLEQIELVALKYENPLELLKATDEDLFHLYQKHLNDNATLTVLSQKKRQINDILAKFEVNHCWTCNKILPLWAFKKDSKGKRIPRCKECYQKDFLKRYRKIEQPEEKSVFRYKEVINRYNHHNQRAIKCGMPYNLTKFSLEIMMNHFLNENGIACCAYCNIEMPTSEDIECDHFVPISLGFKGSTEDNIVPACKPCNRAKNDYTFIEWITLMERILGVAVNKESFGKLETYLRRYNINPFEEINYREYASSN